MVNNMAETKKVRMFPYSLQIPESYLKPDFLLEKYSKSIEKIRENTVAYGESHLLLFLEGNVNGFLQGRFLKLRSDAPKILKELTAEEKKIELDEGDWIEEISHFILNINDKIILGEYNQSSVRHFATPLDFYLRSTMALSGNDFEIKVIAIDKVLEKVKAAEKFYSVRVKIAKPNIRHLEDKVKVNARGVLSLYRKSDFDLEISVIHKRRKILNKEESLKFILDIYEDKGELDLLKIETKDAAYDLINGTLMHFKDDIVKDGSGRFILSSDFYEKAMRIYNRNQTAIVGNSNG